MSYKIPSKKLIIECDGGCIPNPGNGYGSYRFRTDERTSKNYTKDFGSDYTNNMAEYQILIDAILHVKERVKKEDLSNISLEIVTDSKILIGFINKRKFLNATPHHLQEKKKHLNILLREFGSARGIWKRRSNSVRIFGH